MPSHRREPDDDSALRRLGRMIGAGTDGWTPPQADRLNPPASAGAEGADPVPAPMPRWRVGAHPSGLAWVLAVGLAVLVATGFLMSRQHGGPAAAQAAVPPAAPLAVTTAAPSLVVDVGGRVRRPGLVTLPAGARVADAIAAAGGPLRAADLATMNLAARVSDGQLLLVGVPGVATASGPTSGGTAGPVDLNTATVEQLDALPGVGPVLAQRIVDWRQAHGGFRTVDDLQQVAGIGARKFSDLKALVTA